MILLWGKSMVTYIDKSIKMILKNVNMAMMTFGVILLSFSFFSCIFYVSHNNMNCLIIREYKIQ